MVDNVVAMATDALQTNMVSEVNTIKALSVSGDFPYADNLLFVIIA